MWKNDYALFRRALRGERVSRPVLFDFLMCDQMQEEFAGKPADDSIVARINRGTRAYQLAGYDYCMVSGLEFGFKTNNAHHDGAQSSAMNETQIVTDWDDLKAYEWPKVHPDTLKWLEEAGKELPEGMKFIVVGPNGVLENTTGILGFDNFCMKLYEDPELVKTVVDHVGQCLCDYYSVVLQSPYVGGITSNDDWGHKTQTFISPKQMRQYIFPWHRKIVELAHSHDKDVILHSCGYMQEVADDIAEIGFDGKHSYEDVIIPVEEAWKRWHEKFCIVGGLDMDFVCRKTPQQVYDRARAILEMTREEGHYMLGTGNSLPDYVPRPQYNAMRQAAFDLAEEWKAE
ncbi:MAG: uroporphyrinogen decarboxylase family protein [Eubacteriales bacterium]|nr:uroporphyrinogen decarboxylase family protein [Eubacteriales bacterium]